MTIAVCIRCGAKKLGALTLCPGCGFAPLDNSDKAKAMILTDHSLSRDQIDMIAARIQARLPVTYPEDAIAGYAALLERGAGKPRLLGPGFAVVLVCILIAVTYFVFVGA
jgi:hypothetical protein